MDDFWQSVVRNELLENRPLTTDHGLRTTD
jgi:hypothetical protein